MSLDKNWVNLYWIKCNEWLWYPEADHKLYFPSLFNKIIHTSSMNFMLFNVWENSRPTKNNLCDVLLQVAFAGRWRGTCICLLPRGRTMAKLSLYGGIYMENNSKCLERNRFLTVIDYLFNFSRFLLSLPINISVDFSF